jgi:hypothetical protein
MMIRKILAVIIGYAAMAVFVFITFSLTYILLGTEGSFQSNSYNVSVFWILASIILGFVGAILGGLISIVIGKSKKASMVLAGLVLILGIVLAIPTLSAVDEESLIRTSEVGMIEAMQSAHQPSWLAFLNPLLGAVGVVVGSRSRKESKAE